MWCEIGMISATRDTNFVLIHTWLMAYVIILEAFWEAWQLMRLCLIFLALSIFFMYDLLRSTMKQQYKIHEQEVGTWYDVPRWRKLKTNHFERFCPSTTADDGCHWRRIEGPSLCWSLVWRPCRRPVTLLHTSAADIFTHTRFNHIIMSSTNVYFTPR